MLQTQESPFGSSHLETERRRSTFYVPLTQTDLPPTSSNSSSTNEIRSNHHEDDEKPLDLSEFSCDWSFNSTADESRSSCGEKPKHYSSSTSKLSKRFGVVLDGSHRNVSEKCDTSTPIRIVRAKSRSNILNGLPDKTVMSPFKEKSKTLPQNLNLSSLDSSFTSPSKSSFLLKSTPKISLNYSSEPNSSFTSSPRKSSLGFIRRVNSTKLARNNSLLKSLTSKCVDHSLDDSVNATVNELSFERLLKKWGHDNFFEFIREYFMINSSKDDVSTVLGSGAVGCSEKKVNGIKFEIEDRESDRGRDDDDENGAESGK